MKKMVTFSAILGVIISSSIARADDVIRVLVVQSVATYNDVESVTVFGNRVENILNKAIEDTGLSSDKEFVVHPYLLPATFVADALSTTGAVVDGWYFLRNEEDAGIVFARDTIVPFLNLGYDIAIMQIDSDLPSTQELIDNEQAIRCGVTVAPLDYSDAFNSEDHAFMVVENHDYCMNEVGDMLIVHEFGHLFGGEHQQLGVPGFLPDEFPSNPVPYNHPVAAYDLNDDPLAYTALTTPTRIRNSASFPRYSRYASVTTLGMTGFPEGGVTENMHNLISETTWKMVKQYRPILTVTTAEEVDWWWQSFCWGTPNHSVNLEVATSLGAVSFRYEAEPTWVCWAIAVIGGE